PAVESFRGNDDGNWGDRWNARTGLDAGPCKTPHVEDGELAFLCVSGAFCRRTLHCIDCVDYLNTFGIQSGSVHRRSVTVLEVSEMLLCVCKVITQFQEFKSLSPEFREDLLLVLNLDEIESIIGVFKFLVVVDQRRVREPL